MVFIAENRILKSLEFVFNKKSNNIISFASVHSHECSEFMSESSFYFSNIKINFQTEIKKGYLFEKKFKWKE